MKSASRWFYYTDVPPALTLKISGMCIYILYDSDSVDSSPQNSINPLDILTEIQHCHILLNVSNKTSYIGTKV
jgi:hypothetical protein